MTSNHASTLLPIFTRESVRWRICLSDVRRGCCRHVVSERDFGRDAQRAYQAGIKGLLRFPWPGFQCDPCPSGYSGDGIKCLGKDITVITQNVISSLDQGPRLCICESV